ncbi:uncharacterized protein [Apostichopus japonicus]|uniref:uncharacterized protein n=1 Tax=Stichopus japonicus TaxID=307972 RepID=UPI003AB86113
MAYYINIILILMTLWGSNLSASLDNSPGKDEPREPRSSDTQKNVSTVQDMSTLLQSQSNLQSAYFLGQCLVCPPGPQGPIGEQGDRGMPGRDGRDAILIGSSPVSIEAAEVPVPKYDNEDRHNASQECIPLGAKYTRWGRSSCREDAELIYEGVMVGAHYTHDGGASNYLCLSKDPIFDEPVAGFQHKAYLYGTEYETSASQSLPHLQNSEAPCAVCLAPSRTITLMVPGRTECPTGERDWNLEYKGILMSQHHSQTRTEYICVDAEAEVIPETSGNHNGALLYIVEATCATGGGIPCETYTAGYEVTCAVCSL